MEAETTDLDIHMEAAVEADGFAERGMKEVTKEAEVKSTAAKASAKSANSISSARTSSTTTAASTTTSVLARDTNYTISVLGVARRSGYTLIIMML